MSRDGVVATLIHNPSAGDAHPKRRDLERILVNAGFQVRYQSTKTNWKKAVDDATDLVVAAGGDGTVAKVFTSVAGRAIPVGILPVGTANNVARALGLLGDAKEMVRRWDLDATRPFDVGVARGGGVERLFVEACGGGLLVEAIERGPDEVERPGRLVGNENDRALAMMRSLVSELQPTNWHVRVDGADHSGDYIAVEAMNIRLAGPGIPLAPDADAGDGLFDVALVREDDRPTLLEYIDARIAHEQHAPPVVTVARGREIELDTDADVFRIDDELVTVRGPLDLSIRPAAVRYVHSGD